jgi:hypothetical protein
MKQTINLWAHLPAFRFLKILQKRVFDMENVYWIAGAAAVGAVAAPVGLSLLGFSAIGPVAGSVASWGIGGAGGGAAWGFATVQSVAMTTFMSAKIGAVSGAVLGAAKSLV